jgi:putative peptidoglycan lipid II flippase
VTRTAQLALMSAANIGSSLLFNWVVLVSLGAGVESDALFAAMTVPQLFASVISSSITHALTPLLAGETPDAQMRDAWSLFAICGLLFLGVAVALAAGAPWWVPWIVPGFSEEGKALTVLYAQISMTGIIFTGVNGIQVALAFAQGRFIWSDTAPILASIAALTLLIMLLPSYGAVAAAWTAVFRLLFQTLLLFKGMGWPRRPDFHRPSVIVLWGRLKPLIAGASYYKMDPLVDRFLVSTLAPGSLSLLYLAQQLHGAGSQVLGKAMAVPTMTRLSVAAKSGHRRDFARQFRHTFAAMLAVGLLLVVGLLVIGRPTLATVMAHGELGREDSQVLWWLLVLTSGLLVGGSIGTLTAGAFYAVGDTKTPTVLGSVSFTIAIFVKVVAFSLFGLEGLALAISIYYLASLALMTGALYRRGLLATRSDQSGAT